MKNKLGICEICGKEIVHLEHLENNPDDSCYVVENLLKIPTIYASYGSSHDGDTIYFRDRTLLNQCKEKLKTQKELYICDDCIDANPEKFEIFEYENFPGLPTARTPIENCFVTIHRNCIAFRYDENLKKNLMDTPIFSSLIRKFVDTGTSLRIISESTGTTEEIKQGEVIVIYADMDFEIMPEKAFNRRFINFA